MRDETTISSAPPSSAAAFIPPPTEQDIQAAVYILMRAWAPSVPLPGDPGYDQGDDYDTNDQCGCGGEDEYGNDLGCNCGPSCICDSCQLYAWQQYRTCWRPSGSYGPGCGAAAQYRVVIWALRQQSIQDVTLGATCPHPPDERCLCHGQFVYADAGLTPQEVQYRPACSPAHAQEIIAQDQAWRQEREDVGEERMRYRVERWTYTPHYLELPEGLAVLQTAIGSAANNVAHAVDDFGRGHGSFDWLRYGREYLARAAWRAAQPVDAPPADEDFDDDPPSSSAMEEPSEPDEPLGAEPYGAEVSAP